VNEQKAIVRGDLDREEWVGTLAHVCGRFAWRILAWCLMDNHFHLVLETPKANLARGMRQLNGRYAQRFNRRHRRVGHLFQSRYKAFLVERGPHLLRVCRYAVLNPERTRSPQRYDTYPWSSYRSTAGLEPAPRCLDSEQLLAELDGQRPLAQRRYRAFVRAGLEDPETLSVESEIYLAERAYIRRRRGEPEGSPEIPRAQREPLVVPLEQLLRAGNRKAIGWRLPRKRLHPARDRQGTRRPLQHGQPPARRAALTMQSCCAARPDPDPVRRAKVRANVSSLAWQARTIAVRQSHRCH
jgi:putative transposase